MNPPSPHLYEQERNAHRKLLLQDRTLLVRARISLVVYVLWWLVIFPWAFMVPYILFLAALKSDRPLVADVILAGAWEVIPKGTVAIFALMATVIAIWCRPYRSLIEKRLDQHMHDWALVNFPPRRKSSQQ